MKQLLNSLLYKHGQIPLGTLLLIFVSIAVAIYSQLGAELGKLVPLLISEYRGNSWSGLIEVQQGEYWRLITPIFIHFGLLHLLFNMMWLWDLSGAIETRWNTVYLTVLVLLIGISSNLCQYLMDGALFGGMSGVVYGLLAYLYVLGQLRPELGLRLNPQVMGFMMIWFVICWTGLVGGIANWAHTAGLVVGAFFAGIHSQVAPRT